MNFDLTTLFGLGGSYLVLLFGIAYITEKGWIPERVVKHPLVYVLSLGAFASVWAFYTTIGNAYRDGYGFLAQYIGICLAFLLSPLLLRPILELTRTYQLSSLPDLLAFRYRSPAAGTIATLVSLAGVTPLISLQIQVVSDTAGILAPGASQDILAFSFCLMITLFAILFGTSSSKSQTGNTRHDGLVMAIAFESVVKMIALLIVGIFAIYGGFGGLEEMNAWLEAPAQSHLLQRLSDTNYFSSFHVSALLFFSAAIAMPHMFYMTFNENESYRAMSLASWGLPLYFLLLSLPVLPILWAGLATGSDVQPEYFPVIVGAENGAPLISLLAYLGGLSAASGLIIVLTLALANMSLNHLILPLYQPSAKNDIYQWLLWQRRILITALIWAGFLFYYLPDIGSSLQFIGIVAFTACLQFLPGSIAILYWPQGNKTGFICGLLVGIAIWFFFLLWPLTSSQPTMSAGDFDWQFVAAFSLILNSAVFVFGSLYTKTTDAERSSADVCALDTIKRRRRTGLVAKSIDEFIRSLSKPLGKKTATREVRRAMADVKLERNDNRPYSLRLLRGRIESNLSGLMGPSIARELIDGYLPYSNVGEHGSSDVNVIENRIEAYRSNLSGMAADLDNLRRYHRQILLNLPIGVCSLGSDSEIIMWNLVMEDLTGLTANDAVGSFIGDLPEPWKDLLLQFSSDDNFHSHKHSFALNGQKKTVNLHKANIAQEASQETSYEGLIILIEDITETEQLEAGLTHNERLASIGRLAAGVAHEIGNPITGIACLAQNIRDEYDNTELLSMAQQIIEQTDRTSRILQSLVNFAHAGTDTSHYEQELVSILDCMNEAQTLFSLDKKSQDIALIVECSPTVQVMGDSQRILQVLVNLINNSRDASQPGSTILMRATEQGHWAEISVTDEGIGISTAIRDRIFDPFFTTKEAGEGTGLGLSLVFSIVEDLGGNIDIISPVNSTQASGTRVVVRFPCYDDGASSLAESATATSDSNTHNDRK